MVPSSAHYILRMVYVFLIIGSLVGYLAPYWIEVRSNVDTEIDVANVDVQVNQPIVGLGLFYSCVTLGVCMFLPWNLASVEVLAVRILVIFSGLFAIISFICVIKSCCTRRHVPSFKLEGVFGFLSGVTGIAAVATFGATFPFPAEFLGWAFFLSSASTGLTFLISIAMMCVSFKYKKYFQSTTAAGYDNQGYAMEWSSPAVNAVRY